MEPKTNHVALINFISKDPNAKVMGYINFPPCKHNDTQYEIFNDDGELTIRYNDENIKLEPHLTVYDKWKVTEVALLNNWKMEPSHAVVEIIQWNKAFQ